MYKFIYKKHYYRQPTHEFNLPAGHSCPFAKGCKIKTDRDTGKMDIIGKEYRCYAAVAERFPGVRQSRWHNFELLKTGEKIEIPKNCTHMRIHASGDFYSQDYFDLWLDICRENPNIKFWAFTKSLKFWINRIDSIPSNLTMQASYGGHLDDLIEKHNLKYAKVFKNRDEAEKSGLPIDCDDTLAMEGEQSFALVDNFSKK